MRTFIAVFVLLTGFSTWAAGTRKLEYRQVLSGASCGSGTSEGDGSTSSGSDKSCGFAGYTYCSKNTSDPQCKNVMKGKQAASKQSPRSLDISGSTVDDVLQKANQIEMAGPLDDSMGAQHCCGGNTDACRAELPADSDASKASQSISDANTKAKANSDTGVKDKCEAYKQGTENATTYSAGIAGACKAYRSMCMQGYRALKSQLEEKAQSAANDQDRERYNTAANDYESKAGKCEALSASALDSNSDLLAGNSAIGEECNKKTDDGKGDGKGDGKTPQSTASGDSKSKDSKDSKGGDMGSMMKDLAGPLGQVMQALTKQDDKKSDSSTATPDCSNAATGGCYQAASASNWNSTDSGAGTGGSTSNPSGNFDVADTSGSNVQNPFAPSSTGAASPISVASVPGGGGGGIGGMGGGGSANLGGAGGGGGGGGAKSNTDIMHGEGGGGGGLAAMNAGMSTAAGGASGGYTYGKGAKDDKGDAVDWRQFLPGGAKDPTRKLASTNATRTEIQPASTNIFNRISERIRARCAQGLLRDCN